MGERTGIVTFLNIHDYIGADGHPYSGCLASIEAEEGGETLLYATSDLLILALTTFYATRNRATVDFGDTAQPISKDNDLQKERFYARKTSGAVDGPFNVKAIWDRSS